MIINKLTVEAFSEFEGQYDLAIAALGYETRARFVSETISLPASTRLAVGFRDRHVLAYEKNKQFFRDNGFIIFEEDVSGLRRQISTALERMDNKGRAHVIADISSFTRERIAVILAEIMRLPAQRMTVDFVYSPAAYSDPPLVLGPIQNLGPATPEFAGWSPDVDKPVLAVVGLGYEQDRAVGAIEYLEPGEVWAFYPLAKDQRYSRSLEEANKLLWRELPLARRVHYSVDRPYDLFVRLESLIFGSLAEFRPILVPFGPKIFALVCLLLGCQYSGVGVWRVSSGTFEAPLDRIPSGEISGLRVRFESSEP
jgi:hypothetical protein